MSEKVNTLNSFDAGFEKLKLLCACLIFFHSPQKGQVIFLNFGGKASVKWHSLIKIHAAVMI